MKKYNSIIELPKAVLWKNLHAHVRPLRDTVSQGSQVVTEFSGRINNSTARNNPSYAVPGTSIRQKMATFMVERGKDDRGQNYIQKRYSIAQKDSKKTLH